MNSDFTTVAAVHKMSSDSIGSAEQSNGMSGSSSAARGSVREQESAAFMSTQRDGQSVQGVSKPWPALQRTDSAASLSGVSSSSYATHNQSERLLACPFVEYSHQLERSQSLGLRLLLQSQETVLQRSIEMPQEMHHAL